MVPPKHVAPRLSLSPTFRPNRRPTSLRSHFKVGPPVKRFVNLASAGLCAVLLSACTPVETDEFAPAQTHDAASPPAKVKTEPAIGQPAPPKKSKSRVAAKIDDDPRRLIGLDVKSLARLLGTPGFTRRDPPAQLWRYRDKGCILDLFLYETPKQKSASIVRHFEARSLSKINMTARSCLRALLIARIGPISG